MEFPGWQKKISRWGRTELKKAKKIEYLSGKICLMRWGAEGAAGAATEGGKIREKKTKKGGEKKRKKNTKKKREEVGKRWIWEPGSGREPGRRRLIWSVGADVAPRRFCLVLCAALGGL